MSAGVGGVIHIVGLSKAYGSQVAVDDVTLEVDAGEFVTLLGPSGSGKTSILMMIAGFTEPTSGDIRVNGRSVVDTPPHRRNMGVVFQSYALFPHKTVGENVAFPLRMRGVGRAEVAGRVQQALDMVGLHGYGARLPKQLSGGQQQRVALARALVFEPPILLMDEPLGALDKKLREQMQAEIKGLQRRLGVTVLYVTHDQEEALSMSHRIVLMQHGKVIQSGRPQELYSRPASEFVADFLGTANLIPVQFVEERGDCTVVVSDRGLRLLVRGQTVRSTATAVVRPEHVLINPERSLENIFRCRVAEVLYLGDSIRVTLESAGHRLVAKISVAAYRHVPRIDEAVQAGWTASDIVLVNSADGGLVNGPRRPAS